AEFYANRAPGPQSSVVPEYTHSAGPLRYAEKSSLTVISSGPPGSTTVIGVPNGLLPWRTASIAVAAAPVPHAKVRPTPRSHAERLISVGELSVAISILAPPGICALT